MVVEECQIQLPLNFLYQGTIFCGHADGNGRLTRDGQEVFLGIFKDGIYKTGKFSLPNGFALNGDFHPNGGLDGSAEVIYPDGQV